MLDRKLSDLAVVRNEQGARQDERHLCPARRCAAEWGSEIVGWIFEFEHLRLQVAREARAENWQGSVSG